MIRIGCINIDVSHPIAFSRILKEENRAAYMAVYNDGFRKDDEVDAFIKTFGVEKKCENVSELVENSDIIFVQGCNWDKHLSYLEPIIKAKKPVFIDKPMVGSIKDLNTLHKLIENGLKVVGGSSLRYAKEITDFIAIPLEERGEIVNVYGTCGTDYYNYGIHIISAIGGLLQGAESTTYCGNSAVSNIKSENYFVKYKSGAAASYTLCEGNWYTNQITIITTKKLYSFAIDTNVIYRPMLSKIVTFMESGIDTFCPHSYIEETIKIAIAGLSSKINGGKEIELSSLTENSPSYDGDLFEEGYAKTAGNIYRTL